MTAIARGQITITEQYDGKDGHTLMAKAFMEGSYRNGFTKGVKSYVRAFYDGQEVKDFKATYRFRGIGYTKWVGPRNSKGDYWEDKQRDGSTFYVEHAVEYKGLKAFATGRLDNIQDGAQGVPGKDGKDGRTSYFHVKYADVASPTSSSQINETGGDYIGTYVDFTQADSDDPTKYTWVRTKGAQGADGTQGVPGKNGADGRTSYLHIKYSNDGGATFTSNGGEDVGTYIGQYVDFNMRDSDNPRDYKWSLIKGEKGEKGENGVDGKNGEKGKDGTDGKDAANVYLSTQMLLVNTNDSGVVEEKDLNGIEAQVLAYRGDERIGATIVSCQCSPEVAAETQDGDTIKLTAVRTDRKTKMAYGSGYIDIVAEVEGKNYPLRLFVGTNITKLTASVVSDVRSFRQEFGKYQQTTDGKIEWTKSRIEQKARDITMEVAARSQGVNLLQGTDFLGDLTTNVHPGDGTVEITFGDDPQIAHTGHRYMHVVARGLTTQRYAGKSWWAKVEKGKKYTASMWMMTPDKTTIDSVIYLECIAFKGGASPVWLNRHVTPMAQNNTWYVHTDTFGIPDGYDTLQVNAIVVRNGDVYFSEIQLEEGDTRSAWSPYVGDREAELRNTGVYLKDRKIRMRADNFEVENNKGERTFVIDKNGKINARLIDADKIFSEEFQTKNVGKGYLKFHDGLIEVYNPEEGLDIRFGVRNGVMELEFLNEDGSVARAYGKYGEWVPRHHDESFNTDLFISLGDFGNPPTVNAIVGNRDLMRQLFKQNPPRLQLRTPAYYYVAKMYNGQLLPGIYATTAKIAEEADGKYFVSRGDVTTAPRLTAIFPGTFYMPTDGSRKPFDYMLYESAYSTKVVFNDKTPVYSRELYIFENGVRSSVNVYSNTADPLML